MIYNSAKMFIFPFTLKADNSDKICIYNLSGAPEIWVNPSLMAEDRDLVLRALRGRLKDHTITALIQQRGEYMIIRHPNRMKYLELKEIPNKFPDDTILYDDLFFILALIPRADNECDNEDGARPIYSRLSDRLKKDVGLLAIYLSPDIDDRFPELSITKELAIELIKYSGIGSSNIWPISIYKCLSLDMRYDIDIIKTVLLNSRLYLADYMSDLKNLVPPIMFEYDFIIKNFDSECITKIYLWLTLELSCEFNHMDPYDRLALLKIAADYITDIARTDPFVVIRNAVMKLINDVSKYGSASELAYILEESNILEICHS